MESVGRESSEPTRAVNFWVSTRFYDQFKSAVAGSGAFHSMSALVRYLMAKFVEDGDRFDDLLPYQDSGRDVKVNVWVGRGTYAQFKEIVVGRRLTVTDAIKALIDMWVEAALNK
jgi:hypothetical protein